MCIINLLGVQHDNAIVQHIAISETGQTLAQKQKDWYDNEDNAVSYVSLWRKFFCGDEPCLPN